MALGHSILLKERCLNLLNVLEVFKPSKRWQGIVKAIAPNKITTSFEKTNWKALEDSNKNHLILHLSEAISISCPRQLESNQESFFIVDWQASSSILYRGIRHFSSDKLKNFTLQTFTS